MPTEAFVSVHEIVKNFLVKEGYDGLFNAQYDCGCSVQNFMPCGCESIDQCVAGHEVKSNNSEYDFLIIPGKKEVNQRMAKNKDKQKSDKPKCKPGRPPKGSCK